MSRMPNGAKPAGTVLSVKDINRLKLPSNTSTLLFAISAAYNRFPEALFVIANPVYTDGVLLVEVSTAIIAWLRFDWGVHPLMVPSNVANRKIDGHPWTWNSLVVDAFQTMPVGKPGPFAPVGESGPFPAVGINTLSPCATPAAL